MYINSAALISVQDFSHDLKIPDSGAILNAVEPDYKEFIPPALIRRMSKTVKMSVVASQKALKEAHVENPDAIILGAGAAGDRAICRSPSLKRLRCVPD